MIFLNFFKDGADLDENLEFEVYKLYSKFLKI